MQLGFVNWMIPWLSNYEHRPLQVRDGRRVEYFLDGVWRVYEIDKSGERLGLIVRLEAATDICAWLYANEAQLIWE